MRILLIILVFSFQIQSSLAQCCLVDDDRYMGITRRSIDHLNNYEMDKFDLSADSFRVKYESHPSYPLMLSMKIYYESAIDLDKVGEDTTYLNLLTKVIRYSEALLEDNENSVEALFFALCGYGFRAQYYSDNGSFIKSITEGRKAYKYYKKAKVHKDDFAEIMFLTGLYNYYIVQYPENHGIVKPLMGFFEKGDKELGLEQLEYTSKNASFTKASSYIYLIDILLKYEQDSSKALKCAKEFMTTYQGSHLAKISRLKACMISGRFDLAKPIIQDFLLSQNQYLKLHGQLFDLWISMDATIPYESHLEKLDLLIQKAEKNPRICLDFLALAYFKKAEQLQFFNNKNHDIKLAFKKSQSYTYWEFVDQAYQAYQKK